MPTVRVRDDLTTPVSVFVHELKSSVILEAGTLFDAGHPVVSQAAWAFDVSDVPVEQATAAPGEKRKTTRTKQS